MGATRNMKTRMPYFVPKWWLVLSGVMLVVAGYGIFFLVGYLVVTH